MDGKELESLTPCTEGMELFRAPVKRWLNVRSLSGEAVLLSGGELTEQRLVAEVPANSLDKYNENDCLFIGKEQPAEFDPIYPGANYRVVSVSVGHGVTEIILERMASE